MPASYSQQELLQVSIVPSVTLTVTVQYLASIEIGQQLAEDVISQGEKDVTGYDLVKSRHPARGFVLTLTVTDPDAMERVMHRARALLDLEHIVPGIFES